MTGFGSIVLQLFQIALKVSFRFFHRVAAEFLERTAGQRERDHRLAGNTGGRHHAYIRAFVRRLHRLARREIYRLQWTPQRRNRLQIAAYPDLLPVGDATLQTSSIVARAREARKSRVTLITDFIMHGRPRRMRRLNPTANFDRLDRKSVV